MQHRHFSFARGDQTHERLQGCQRLLEGEGLCNVLYVNIQMMKKVLHVINRIMI